MNIILIQTHIIIFFQVNMKKMCKEEFEFAHNFDDSRTKFREEVVHQRKPRNLNPSTDIDKNIVKLQTIVTIFQF